MGRLEEEMYQLNSDGYDEAYQSCRKKPEERISTHDIIERLQAYEVIHGIGAVKIGIFAFRPAYDFCVKDKEGKETSIEIPMLLT